MTDNVVAFVFSNTALVTGVIMMVLRVFVRVRRTASVIPDTLYTFDQTNTSSESAGTIVSSRLPSLLVGWGTGYWVMSLLYVLGGSWTRGGWHNAPISVIMVACLVLPSFYVVTLFMVADTNFLGTIFGS